jgi:hypothetical protein
MVTMLFASALFGIFVGTATANFKPYQPPQITVLSPSPTEVYNSSSVPLNIRVRLFSQPWASDNITSLKYSLDGQRDVPIWLLRDESGIRLYGNSTLSGLSNGLHNVVVHGESITNGEKILFNATVTFTVDALIIDNAQGNFMGIASQTFWAVVVSVVFVAGVALGILVYWKKCKSKVGPA